MKGSRAVVSLLLKRGDGLLAALLSYALHLLMLCLCGALTFALICAPLLFGDLPNAAEKGSPSMTLPILLSVAAAVLLCRWAERLLFQFAQHWTKMKEERK
ncbi:MAG: hypothetical protein OXT69_07350 [Candidatus Poribacteria bacterium]|nr:hypothetical protein [Candidatus Poribacteria bacterium]